MNRINDRHRAEMTEFITSSLESRPELIEHCVPSYPPFGKRILIDNGWFETLCCPHVDLEVTPIARITEDGVVTTTGTVHEVDVIIVATGFDVVSLDRRVNLAGRGGVGLGDVWEPRDPRAFLGISVVGMPNLFVMYGPNTNMGHGGSVMWMSDTQAAHIASWIRKMAEERINTVEVRPEVVEAYTEEIDRLHDELVWMHPGTPTYYRTEEGRVRSPMPFRLVDYWSRTQTIDEHAFVVTHLPPPPHAELAEGERHG
jgi:4-hydroxyacetophenone monooxygenase